MWIGHAYADWIDEAHRMGEESEGVRFRVQREPNGRRI